jgi:HSP20 family protein
VPIRKPDPLRDLLTLQERLNRLFDDRLLRLEQPFAAGSTWTPPADLYETPEHFVVELEVPGLAREELHVEATARQLTVRGERGPVGAQAESYHRMERSYGPFARSFELAAAVDPDGVRATLRDGLLLVELPKTGAPRRG